MTPAKLGHFQLRHYHSAHLTGGEFLVAAFSWHLRKFLPNSHSTIVLFKVWSSEESTGYLPVAEP